MVNASDVYAMGGRPLAIVDALLRGGADAAAPMLAGHGRGRRDASQIPIVGGHTNLRSPYAGARRRGAGPRAARC